MPPPNFRHTKITAGNDGKRDYLSVTYGSQAWIGIYLTPIHSLSSYAEYDYVSVWLYAVADGGEVKFGVSGNFQRERMA